MKVKIILASLVGLFAVCLIVALTAEHTQANSINLVVNTTADAPDSTPGDGACETALGNGQCTLRAALQESNAISGEDSIDIPIAGTIYLTSTLPAITDSVSINGPGSALLTWYGAYNTSAPLANFGGSGGSGGSFSLSGVRITGDGTPGGIYVGSGALTLNEIVIHGMGSPGLTIFLGGAAATVLNSSIYANRTQGGGGIYNIGGTLFLINSSVYGNFAGFGGGGIMTGGTTVIQNSAIYSNTTGSSPTGGNGGGINNSGSLVLINTTVSGNSANVNSNSRGGGIYSSGHLTLTNSTLANNTSWPGLGGGLYVNTGSARLQNTILANSPAGGECAQADGALVDGSYNLVEDNTCGFTGGVDPLLGPLQDNGGPSLTHALLPGSPAIDGGNPAGCLDEVGDVQLTDQRIFKRPVDGDTNGSVICDIGAFEYASSVASATPTPLVTNTRTATPTRTSTPTITPTPPQGVTLFVNSPLDKVDANPGDGICASAPSNECTLRAAVMEANALYGVDTISVPAGLYRLTIAGPNEDNSQTGDLDISSDLNLVGAGAAATIIDGQQLDRVIHIVTNRIVHIQGFTLQNGHPPENIAHGGGINNSGQLWLDHSVVMSNTANGTGGGINSGNLTMTYSTLQGNYAVYGGGGLFSGGGSLLIANSAILSNSMSSAGGSWGSGLWAYGQATLLNSTVANNSGNAHGIRSSGVLTIANSTVVNTGAIGVSPSDVVYFRNSIISVNCVGPSGNMVSQGYNLLNGCTVSGDTTGNITGDHLLGPLQNNGGETFTFALLPGSPAIDAGNPAGCTDQSGGALTTDQRGAIRPADGDNNGSSLCDMGAFEYGAIGLPSTSTPTSTASPTRTATAFTSTPTRTASPTRTTAPSTPTPPPTETPGSTLSGTTLYLPLIRK